MARSSIPHIFSYLLEEMYSLGRNETWRVKFFLFVNRIILSISIKIYQDIFFLYYMRGNDFFFVNVSNFHQFWPRMLGLKPLQMLKNYYNKNVIIFLYSVNEQTVNNFFLKKIISIIIHRYSKNIWNVQYTYLLKNWNKLIEYQHYLSINLIKNILKSIKNKRKIIILITIS